MGMAPSLKIKKVNDELKMSFIINVQLMKHNNYSIRRRDSQDCCQFKLKHKNLVTLWI